MLGYIQVKGVRMKLLVIDSGSQIHPGVDLYLQQLQNHNQNVVEDTTEFDAEMWRKYSEESGVSSQDRLQEYSELKRAFEEGFLLLSEEPIRPVENFEIQCVPKGYDTTLIDPKQNHRPWEESKKELLRRRSRNLSRKLAQKNGRKRK